MASCFLLFLLPATDETAVHIAVNSFMGFMFSAVSVASDGAAV